MQICCNNTNFVMTRTKQRFFEVLFGHVLDISRPDVVKGNDMRHIPKPCKATTSLLTTLADEEATEAVEELLPRVSEYLFCIGQWWQVFGSDKGCL